MNYLTKKEENFFRLWQTEILVEDNRSVTMPKTSKGTVIGIKEKSILLRVNNNFTNWFPLNDDKVNFLLIENPA